MEGGVIPAASTSDLFKVLTRCLHCLDCLARAYPGSLLRLKEGRVGVCDCTVWGCTRCMIEHAVDLPCPALPFGIYLLCQLSGPAGAGGGGSGAAADIKEK